MSPYLQSANTEKKGRAREGCLRNFRAKHWGEEDVHSDRARNETGRFAATVATLDSFRIRHSRRCKRNRQIPDNSTGDNDERETASSRRRERHRGGCAHRSQNSTDPRTPTEDRKEWIRSQAHRRQKARSRSRRRSVHRQMRLLYSTMLRMHDTVNRDAPFFRSFQFSCVFNRRCAARRATARNASSNSERRISEQKIEIFNKQTALSLQSQPRILSINR